MNEYYTYAYLREDRTPYYIGKGKNNRINQRHNKFIKVPPVERRIYLKQNLTEEEAFLHEVYMIEVLGRRDLGTGILQNRTPGGDKPPLCTGVSEETRKKISESHKGKKKPWTWNKGKVTSYTDRATYMRDYRRRKEEDNYVDGRTTRTDYTRKNPSTKPGAVYAREWRKRRKLLDGNRPSHTKGFGGIIN